MRPRNVREAIGLDIARRVALLNSELIFLRQKMNEIEQTKAKKKCEICYNKINANNSRDRYCGICNRRTCFECVGQYSPNGAMCNDCTRTSCYNCFQTGNITCQECEHNCCKKCIVSHQCPCGIIRIVCTKCDGHLTNDDYNLCNMCGKCECIIHDSRMHSHGNVSCYMCGYVWCAECDDKYGLHCK